MKRETLLGKVAVVTGAGSGIGAAIAVDLAARGCRLVLCGRNHERLTATREICLNGQLSSQFEDDVLLVISDMMKDRDIERIIEQTITHFGRLDVLVNNAGVARVHTIEEMTMEEYRMVMRVNLDAPIYLTKLCVPYLERTAGCVINISSNASVCASRMEQITFLRTQFPGSLAYSVSKAAMDHMTKCLALELALKRIRVNSINPGVMPTGIFEKAGIPDVVVRQIVSDQNAVNCLGRCGRLDDLTGLIYFLTTENSAYTTGHTFMVNGGWDKQCFRYEYDTGLLADDNGNLSDLKAKPTEILTDQ